MRADTEESGEGIQKIAETEESGYRIERRQKRADTEESGD